MNLGQVLNLLQGGANPQNLLMQFLQQNPGMQAGLPLVKNKTPTQLQQTFFNLCRERGIDPQQYAQMMGVRLPK